MKNYHAKHGLERALRKKTSDPKSRTLKVQYKSVRLSRYELRKVPLLAICGLWLQDAGFDVGSNVNVVVLNGQVILAT